MEHTLEVVGWKKLENFNTILYYIILYYIILYNTILYINLYSGLCVENLLKK